MISDALKKEFLKLIASFHDGVLGPWDLGYELDYDDEIADIILNHYLPIAHAQSEKVKQKCLGIMIKSCNKNNTHGHLADWQGALENLIIFSILPTESYHEIEATQPQPCDLTSRAISSVIRFSRWYHTDNNFWTVFKPYAQKIVRLLWGEMEVLNRSNP